MITIFYQNKTSNKEDLTVYGAFKHTEPNAKNHEEFLTNRPTILKITPIEKFAHGKKVSFHSSAYFPKEWPFYYMSFESEVGIKVSIRTQFTSML